MLIFLVEWSSNCLFDHQSIASVFCSFEFDHVLHMIYIYKYWLLLLLLLLLLLINFPLYQYSFLLQILQPFSSFRTCCSSSLAFPVWTDVYQYLNKAIDIISVSQILPSSEGAVPHKKWGLLLYSIYPWQCSISVITKPNRFLISAKFVIDISFGLYYHQNSTF